MSKYLTDISGDEVNGRIMLLRSFGYERISVVGHGKFGLTYSGRAWESYNKGVKDRWDICLDGGPCGGDHEECLGIAPKNYYLCPFCERQQSLPRELKDFLGLV